MKKIYFIFIFIFLFFTNVGAQTNLVQYEYWFNSDHGSSQVVTITPISQHQLSLDIDATALPDGVNVLNLRYMDENGVYSSILSKVFYKNPAEFFPGSLQKYEYWFNNDYGSSQVVTITPASQHQLSLDIDASALPDGVNVLNMRYKDENGFYSSILSKVFYKNPAEFFPGSLQKYEYWFNNDYGSSQVVTITPASQHQLSLDIDASALPDGVNVLNMRYKDENGFYSSILSKVFYKNPDVLITSNLKKYEYWFNNDYNNKQVVDISPSLQHQLIADLDASPLADGVNVLNIRYQDENDTYSSTVSKVFYKLEHPPGNNELIAYQYWYNDDYEDAIYVNMEAPAQPFHLLDDLHMTHLPVGEYVVHFQFLDSYGLWSAVTTDSVIRASIPEAAFSISSTTFCEGSAISFVNESIDANLWYWDFGDGCSSVEFEPDHVYTAAGNYMVSLTVTDDNGYSAFASGSITVNALPQVSLSDFDPVCADAPAFALYGGLPEGGTYSGTGINEQGWFDPQHNEPGTFEIAYDYADVFGCTSQATGIIIVNHLPETNNLEIVLCDSSGDGIIEDFDLTDYQSLLNNQEGISFTWFDENFNLIPDPAHHIISSATIVNVKIKDANDCYAMAVMTFDVLTIAVSDLQVDFCDESDDGSLIAFNINLNDFNEQITGDLPEGTILSWFSDQELQNEITATVNAVNGDEYFLKLLLDECIYVGMLTFIINPLPEVTFHTGNFCLDAGNINLEILVDPIGGIFEGEGVIGIYFDPTIPGPGQTGISYIFTDNNHCSRVVTSVMEVFPLPEVTFTFEQQLICEDHSPLPLSGGLPEGGQYYGPGIDNGLFYPSIAGPGEHSLMYEFIDENGCSNSAVQVIMVEICTNAEWIYSEEKILIYPNPVRDYLNIKIDPTLKVNQLKIIDSAGKIVHSSVNPVLSPSRIDTGNLLPGIYTIIFSTSKGNISQGFILLY